MYDEIIYYIIQQRIRTFMKSSISFPSTVWPRNFFGLSFSFDIMKDTKAWTWCLKSPSISTKVWLRFYKRDIFNFKHSLQCIYSSICGLQTVILKTNLLLWINKKIRKIEQNKKSIEFIHISSHINEFYVLFQ